MTEGEDCESPQGYGGSGSAPERDRQPHHRQEQEDGQRTDAYVADGGGGRAPVLDFSYEEGAPRIRGRVS